MPKRPPAAPVVTELALSAVAGVDGQFTFVFTLSLASRRLVFRLTTGGPVSVEQVLKALGDQFGFKLPELPGIGSFRPWDALYRQKLTPELAFSPNAPRMFQGGMKLETPLEIPLIPDCSVQGVRARWQQAGAGKPAAWDFAIDATLFGRKQTLTFPFAVPQPKPPLIDIKYFGLGQRVSPNLQGATTMAAVMEKMRADLRQEPGDKLVERLAAYYRPDAGWLAGIWLTVRDLVDLQVVFNDPVLYGVALKAGARLGFLKGLAFEVLYQRISDEVGLFYIDLTLPIALREIFMGAWSITLPSIALWIYTNGDFKVSLGWPLGERSFTIQYLFLIGGGGFYLAKLSSATAPDVPPAPPGQTYNPVLAFGIALRLGVGREFNKGILSASLSLTLQGVFEGRVAWLRPLNPQELIASGASADEAAALLPASSSASTELAAFGGGPSVFDYFWFRGTFGIVGVVQGVVDFAIIKATVTVRLEASVTVTFATRERTTIRVYAGVTVRLRVEVASFKVFGYRVHIYVDLSFHADISEEFVIDSSGAERALRAAMARQEALAWSALRLPWADVRPVLPLLFAPRLTRVEGEPYFVATLTIPTRPQGGAAWSPFEALARALAEWMGGVQARADGVDGPGRAQALDRDRLAVWGTRLARARYLNVADPGNRDPLTYEKIVEFLDANFILEIGVPPPIPPGEEPPPEVPGAVFPIVPPLVLVVTGQASGRTRTIRFDDTARRDARYVRNLRAYYDEMRTAFAGPADRMLARARDEGTPMSRLVFEDYFAAILKEMRAELDRVVAGRGPLRMLEALDEVDYDGLAARVSRFMQAGLRPPNEAIPDDRGSWPALTLAALYGQTGQQFPMELGPADYVLDLQVPEGVRNWLRPAEAGTRIAIAAGDRPAREAFEAFKALPLIPEILEKRWLAPLASRPLRLTLQQLAPWAGEGEAPRWLATVSAALAAAVPPEGRVLDVYAAPPTSAGGLPAPIPWAPAVRVELSLSRVRAGRREGEVDPEGRAGEFVSYLYQLGGADERNRRVLEGLLAGGGDLANAEIHLAYPAADGAPGLRSRAAGKAVLLLKTNLSTESNPHDVLRLAARLAEADRDPVLATLAERRDFLTLVWQAGVVSSGGFYLYYEDAAGEDLPAGLFAHGPSTPFTLLVTFPAGPGARLFPWHNALTVEAAALAAGDAGERTLYVAPRDVLEWDAANPAGSVAFEVRRRNPNRTLAPPPRLSLAASDEMGGVTRDELLAAARAAGVAPGSDEERALLDEAGSEAAELQNLFNLLQFHVRANEEFRQSVWSVPVGPGTPDNAPDAGERFRRLRAASGFTEPADWLYQQVPAVFRFARGSQGNPDPSRYAGVGGRVRLEFRVLDMFGNVMDDSDPVGLPNTEVLFYDRLAAPAAWPGCALEYHLAREAGAARLRVVIRFAAAAVVPRPGQGVAPGRDQAEAAAGAHVAWARIYDQLRDERTDASAWFSVVPDAPLPADRARLAAFARAIRDWLGGIHPGEPWPADPPPEAVLEWSIADQRVAEHREEAFPVEAALRLRRTEWVAPEAAEKNPASEKVESPVPPHIPREPTSDGGEGPQRLQRFAEEFEAAFDGRLKLALGAETGVAGQGGATDEVGGELWAIRVGPPGGIVVTPGAARHYFAPAPLSRHLATGTFLVRRYVEGEWKGTASDYAEADGVFAQVDLDGWAAAFLAGVDALLAPSLASAIARLAPDAFTALMDHKEAIARAVSATVAPVFEPDGGGEGDRDAAVEAMYQRLLIRLAAAYEVDTIVQLPMTVSVPPPPVGSSDEPRYYGAVAAAVPVPTGAAPGDPDASVAQFSVARLSLRPPDGQGGEFVRPLTFLFTAANPVERRSFAGRLRWTVGFLEHRVLTLAALQAGERAYHPSSWLRFVRTGPDAELAVDLGDFEVPVPLRRFPQSPDLVRQSANPTHPEPTTLAEALRWSYAVEYRQREIAQDRIVLDADYNVRHEAPALRAAAAAADGERPLPGSLFEALARWSAEAPAVWAHAPAIAAAADGDDGKKVEALAVIARFADLVRGAALTWAAHSPLRANALAAITDRYWLEDEDGGTLIRVRRFPGAAGFPVWPDVAGYEPVSPPPADDAEVRLYRRLPRAGRGRAPLAAEVTRALTFPAHRLAERQNALGRLRIVRNARLSDERKTNPAFIYETAAVSFGNPVTPLVTATGLSLDGLPGATLPARLAAFFSEVFEPDVPGFRAPVGDDERLIRLEVGYRFALAQPEGAEPLFVTLPLLLVHDYRFKVATDWNPAVDGSLARQLVVALADWHRREQPAGAAAALVFTLVMFSSFGADTLPLLTLDALPLTAPADPAWWSGAA